MAKPSALQHAHMSQNPFDVLPLEFPATPHRNVKSNTGLIDGILDEPIFQPLLRDPQLGGNLFDGKQRAYGASRTFVRRESPAVLKPY